MSILNHKTFTHGPLALTLLSLLASPLLAAPPGERPIDPVLRAYRQTDQYQAVIHYRNEQHQDGWVNQEWGDFTIALDRPTHRLKVDTPDFLLVSDGRTLYLQDKSTPKQYREFDAPDPLTYPGLIRAAPAVGQRPLVDLAFLLSDDPVAVLSGGVAMGASPASPDPDDPVGTMRLTIPLGVGELVLTPNPKTDLLDLAVAKGRGGPGTRERTVYDIEQVRRNQRIDDSVFAFDTRGLQRAGSAAGRGNGSGGGASGGGSGSGGGGTSGGGGLVGKPAPPMRLATDQGKPWSLKDVLDKNDAVVLVFWASYAPSCRPALEQMEQLRRWTQDQGLPAEVVAVACGDSAEEVRKIWQQRGYTMPVALDTDMAYAQPYALMTVPHTVVIGHGKIQAILTGSSDDMQQQMQKRIQKILATPPEASPAPGSSPPGNAPDHQADPDRSPDDSPPAPPEPSSPQAPH